MRRSATTYSTIWKGSIASDRTDRLQLHADALLVLVAWPATAETHKSEGDWETETGRKEERERERERERTLKWMERGDSGEGESIGGAGRGGSEMRGEEIRILEQ